MTRCAVGPAQEPASAIPGNIGIVRAKVMIWDHDPFLSRPHQITTFPLTQSAAEAAGNDQDFQFELNAAFLKPRYVHQDMFIGTKNNSTGQVFLDLVGSISSGAGSEATDRLPGGSIYENGDPTNYFVGKNVFPHQLWLHVGNLFKRGVAMHPSEYNVDLSQVRSAQNLATQREIEADSNLAFSKFTITELQSAPKWDYVIREDNGVKCVWPYMISKQIPDLNTPCHWSLEKFTPLWQGEDFFVTIFLGDKITDDAVDQSPENDIVDTNWPEYKFLLYNVDLSPSAATSQGTSTLIDGFSNEPFYLPYSENLAPNQQSAAQQISSDPARREFWWKYKTYILIEIGAGSTEHNYFIEIVKGRKPRFIHLGEEWDNPIRTGLQVDTVGTNGWAFWKKSRVLSVCEDVSSDDLFNQDSFSVYVRNHLGRLVVTFSGHEDTPWVITKQNHDPTRNDFSTVVVPIVVPAAKMRIHGGNISCALNFAPTQYVPKSFIPFTDRQADTYKATNDDLYVTFCHMGSNVKYENRQIKKYFRDRRFGFGRIGYDCDAYITEEYLQNTSKRVPIYSIYNEQYRRYGKGWVLKRPTDAFGQPQIDPDTQRFRTHALENGVKNNPHALTLFNFDNINSGFRFGLSAETDGNYPYKEFASRWNVGLAMSAGSVDVPTLGDNEITIDSSASQSFLFTNCVTPIATSWSLTVLGGEKPIKGNVESFDVGPLATSIQDSWSADGLNCVNHETKIRCYIPIGTPMGGNPSVTTASTENDIHALGQRLLSLHDKSFYVTVSYWWENGVGERDVPGNRIPRTTHPYDSDLLIAMTGIAYGAQLERSVNKLFMSFTVKDYMSVMQKQFIFNSPFFDGVSDSVAIYELAKLAGFDDDNQRTSGIDRRPLGYLQKVIQDTNNIGDGQFIYNGEISRSRRYDLPGSYADIANPAVRFQNGETYESALKKIAQYSSKMVYFDRWGILRYESIPAIDAAFASSGDSFKPVFNFVTTPFPLTGSSSPNAFVFDPTKHASHLVYDVVNYARSVEDCVNQIVLLTASNDIQLPDGSKTGGLIVEGYTFFEQIVDPSSEGFLGFRKSFYQSNGIFGGIEGVRNALQQYAKMKYPPATVNFQTFGVPGLKALDIIALDDNLYYITEISHEIDPATNNWRMSISGEWLKSFNGSLGFLQERGPSQT